ncbi:MAG: sugar ABC transporter permease [Spirochaetia bacterium]|nr:sugar ABC transporter permease [Spirochaetia bacterium]
MKLGLSKRKEEKAAWGLIAPAVIVVGILIAYPTILNFYLSFFDVRLDGSRTFVGMDNYTNLLSNPRYYASIWTTFIFLLGSVTGSTLLGLGTALLMNKDFPFRALVRTLIILPYFAPVISMVFGWQFIFDPVNGIFNFVFAEKLHLIPADTNLIGDPKSVMWVLIAFTTWKYFPITYLLILSRLQLIDKSLYEAATIDGAGKRMCFLHITLPEIFFVLGTTILLRIIWNLNRFEDIYLLSPQIKTLSVFIYEQAFAGVIDQGLAAAAAFIQLFLAGIGIVYYIRKVLKW